MQKIIALIPMTICLHTFQMILRIFFLSTNEYLEKNRRFGPPEAFGPQAPDAFGLNSPIQLVIGALVLVKC